MQPWRNVTDFYMNKQNKLDLRKDPAGTQMVKASSSYGEVYEDNHMLSEQKANNSLSVAIFHSK